MDPILAIVGATATGKSALALELAPRLGGEIVNADALQVYRGLDIGTAKATAEERRRVPHHLLDILEPHESFSAGEFARRAGAVVAEIGGRGRLPIVVGGSGLYVRALLDGISEVPPADPEQRRKLRRRLAADGLAALRAELEAVDPATARRLAPGDTQRVLRALEVYLSTGRPLSSWIAERPFGSGALPAVRIGLTVPRRLLYDRIAVRVQRMLSRGWLEEVERLLASGLSPSDPAFQAIGYRELARHLTGEWTLEEAADRIAGATRRFAKRQETWFRRDSAVRWFPAADLPATVQPIADYLDRSGLRGAHVQAEH